MKIILAILIFLTFVLTSCDNNASSPNNDIPSIAKTEIGKLNDFLKQYEVPSQFYKVSSNKASKVIGKQGTIISINPADLESENGQAIGENIEVELKELTNQEQLLRSRAQTISDGNLLVSGGAYYINMTSDGQQLKLKNGKNLAVSFPKIAKNEMSLFYGQRDSLGQMNWLQDEQKFTRKADFIGDTTTILTTETDDILAYIESESNKLTQEEKDEIEKINELQSKKEQELKKYANLNKNVYDAINLNKFGWINCDKFYEVKNKTNLQFAFNKKDSIESANVYLVFTGINSLMESNYISMGKVELTSGFEDIPVGIKARLIAFSMKKGKVYSYKSDMITKSNETVQLSLKETNQDKVGELFQLN